MIKFKNILNKSICCSTKQVDLVEIRKQISLHEGITITFIFYATCQRAALLTVFSRYNVRLEFNLPNEQSFYLVTIHCGNIRARPRCIFIVLFTDISIRSERSLTSFNFKSIKNC